MTVIRNPRLTELQCLAAEQRGLFSLEQARRLGMDQRSLSRCCQRGWMRRVRRGVYTFGGTSAGRWEPAIAAALAAGPGAVLSHRTAAAIHAFDGVIAGPVPELTMPQTRNSRLGGVVVHRTDPVPASEQVVRRGVAVTSPARTVLDLGQVFGADLVGAILDDGAVRRLWSFAEVASLLDAQGRRRWGAPLLRDLLAVRLADPFADSHLEQRVMRQIEPLQPFNVHYQQILSDIVVVLDVAWPVWKVAAEIDGRSYRTTSRTAHDRETRKLNLLAAAGWKVAHLSSTMSPQECIEAVLALMPPGATAMFRRRGLPAIR